MDLIALPDSLYPSPLDPAHRAPAWAGGHVRLYDLTMPVPGPTAAPPIHVDGRSLLDASGIQITSLPGWSDSWTGTDWVLYREAEPSTRVPAILERGQRWFPGQLAPQNPGQRIAVRFNASRGQLEHRLADGAWSAVGDAAGALPAGSYVLTLRFSADGRPVFFVPIAVMALGGKHRMTECSCLGAPKPHRVTPQGAQRRIRIAGRSRQRCARSTGARHMRALACGARPIRRGQKAWPAALR